MGMQQRCTVLPIETDDRLSVRGLIGDGYVRVQVGRNDFFIPANTFKRAYFAVANGSMKVGDRHNGDPVSFQRADDESDGEKVVRFTVRTSAGEIKHMNVHLYVMAEVVERIDQTKALLHTFEGTDEVTSPGVKAHASDSDQSHAACA